MPDETLHNHGNHVEANYGTIHQYINQPPPRPPRWTPPTRKQVALLGGLATALLGAWGFYAQGSTAHPARAYYCASGGHVKYHASPDCPGLTSCSARVASLSMARVKQRQLAPCKICY